MQGCMMYWRQQVGTGKLGQYITTEKVNFMYKQDWLLASNAYTLCNLWSIVQSKVWVFFVNCELLQGEKNPIGKSNIMLEIANGNIF